MAIDRHAITETVSRAGEMPAYCLTPPNTAGFTAVARLREDVAARRSSGRGRAIPTERVFPPSNCSTTPCKTTRPSPRPCSRCGRRTLTSTSLAQRGMEGLFGFDAPHQLLHWPGRMDWRLHRPSTFMDLFTTDSGNNETGWSNADYDRLCREASKPATRLSATPPIKKPKRSSSDEMPIIPVYVYTNPASSGPASRGGIPTCWTSPTTSSSIWNRKPIDLCCAS